MHFALIATGNVDPGNRLQMNNDMKVALAPSDILTIASTLDNVD